MGPSVELFSMYKFWYKNGTPLLIKILTYVLNRKIIYNTQMYVETEK